MDVYLTKVGADKIIYPEQSMGLRVARNLMSGGYLDVFELSAEFSMAEFSHAGILDWKKLW